MVEQQPNVDYSSQTIDYSLGTLLPFETGIIGALDCGIDSGQATTPRPLDTGGNYQPMDRDQATPVLTHQAALPPTVVPAVETKADNSTTK